MWRTHRRERNWDMVRPTCLQWLAKADIPIPNEVGPAYMAGAVLRAYAEIQDRSLAQLLKAWPILAPPEAPPLAPLLPPAGEVAGAHPAATGGEQPEPQPGVTLSQMVELYRAERDLAGKSADELAAAARRSDEVHGLG
ncbi:hypothetical protein J8J14_18635 [Roseomonas sp. SSH11]|uniref:Uncharacterized protein n=1 Tax=Pararoseomonas baculiformis TaxID=2820812 RepID=A0ABS4AID8_9PROT|nr:hypothetical protein [Pararoseomonas baculiformis]MBP0446797.1 hypothetical protein [Pararoseomonas baculiformis]